MNNEVGIGQIKVQARVIGTCRVAGAVATIATTGNVTCTTPPPHESGTSLSPTVVKLGSGSTAVATRSASRRLLVPGVRRSQRDNHRPERLVGAGTVDCTLSVTPSATATPTAEVTGQSSTSEDFR